MINHKQENMWVLMAQSGDKEAFNKLLKAIESPLYRYIFSLVSNEAVAEDILQEVFIKIYRKLFWLREVEVFRPWAYRIASRETFKFLAKERKWSETLRDEIILEKIPVEEIDKDSAIDLSQIQKLIEQISPASRAVIVLHYINEMSLDEIADVLGIALGTVKSRLAYGLSFLRKEIARNI